MDSWTYRRDVDTSKLRLAAATVGNLIPSARVTLNGAVVEIRVCPPLADFFGMVKKRIARGIISRCAHWVPRMCGWCPEVKVLWVK